MIPNPRRLVLCAALAAGFLLCGTARVVAAVSVAPVFSDHMVVQRDQSIRVWGKADANATVRVQLGDQRAEATSDGEGRWLATFKAVPAGGPFELQVSCGDSTVSLKDILVGDVFLCSGQSNMQLPLKEAQGGAEASESAAQFKMLRLLLVPKAPAAEPSDQIKAKWTQCTPDSVANISAVAFFFADALRKSPAMKDVPIGLIDSSFGGTCVEGWISSQTLAKSYKPEDLRDSMFGIKPSNLYNAMIAPLVPLNIKGVLWYQGESNAPSAELYDKLLTTMIEEWRGKFQSPDLPFFIVQLPNYPGVMEGASFVWIRDAETKVAASVPNTWMAVTIDTPDGIDLHPKAKRLVGDRLALLAREHVYGEKVESSGPTVKSANVEGDHIRVEFDPHGGKLVGRHGDELRGFTVAGEDGVYRNATAKLDGSAVIVHSDLVAAPKTVRYAWSAYPEVDLYNDANLPAAPFRTDTQAIAPIAEVLPAPAQRRVSTANYTLTLDGDGTISSLLVGNQQMLSNDGAGFMLVGFFGTPRQMFYVSELAPDCVEFTDKSTTVRYEFKESDIAIRVKNITDQPIPARLILSPFVKRGGESDPKAKDHMTVTVTRDKATLTIKDVDKVAKPFDAFLELTASIPAKGERTLELHASVKK